MMKRQISPAGYRVLVRLKETKKEKEEVSEGGIIMKIKTNKEMVAESRNVQEAYVIKIGPTAFQAFDDGHAWCKEGDCVLICRNSGDELYDIEDEQIYRIINDRDIQAVFEGEGLQ